MKNYLLNFFRRNRPVGTVPRPPLRGDQWKLKDGDPFDPPRVLVTIRETKEGWVRYSHGTVFNDERMEIMRFMDIYTLYRTQVVTHEPA